MPVGGQDVTMLGPESRLREALIEQARASRHMGSEFTARLCDVLGSLLDRSTETGRRMLDWPGDLRGDAVVLRLAGGLHALTRSGETPALAELYPPNPLPAPDDLQSELSRLLRDRDADLLPWLERPPQTNEVARSAALAAGLLVIAAETGLPMQLHELGASAGLNLNLDRYRLCLGGVALGPADAAVRLSPAWIGPPPPDVRLEIRGRQGVDRHPVDLTRAEERDRMLAYVWPDQPERLQRLQAAMHGALESPPLVDAGDAAEWLEQRLPLAPVPGQVRVVLHSVAFQYFSETARARVRSHLEAAGARADAGAPLAWLRYEHEPAHPEPRVFSLRLRLWAGGGQGREGADRLLGWTEGHARSIEWRG